MQRHNLPHPGAFSMLAAAALHAEGLWGICGRAEQVQGAEKNHAPHPEGLTP